MSCESGKGDAGMEGDKACRASGRWGRGTGVD